MKNKITINGREYDCLFVVESDDYNYFIYEKDDMLGDANVVSALKSKDGINFEKLNKEDDLLVEAILDKFEEESK